MRGIIDRLLRAFDGTWGRSSCRRCREIITTADPFGLSEGVCGPCRADASV
jgi:hypothetical protein